MAAFHLLLDERVLHDLYTFPGHQQAINDWEAENQRSGMKRKTCYAEHYGIDDVESYRRAAQEMARRGARSEALDAVIESCERLAL